MDTAVLVIDVQRAIFDPSPRGRPFEADEVVQRINALTTRARAQRVPVAFIQHQTADGDFAPQSEGWKLERNLVVGPNDAVIAKATPDSFLRTTLLDWLKEHKVKHVVICGAVTEFCVDTTTRSAAAHGYDVILAADAHTTRDKAHASAVLIRTHHNATLPEVDSFDGVISAVNSADIDFQ
jgi:nicotinamidase-related amidase